MAPAVVAVGPHAVNHLGRIERVRRQPHTRLRSFGTAGCEGVLAIPYCNSFVYMGIAIGCAVVGFAIALTFV